MKKIAVFPGSFDPITRGHENIVQRASLLFDEIIVAIGVNTTKASLYSTEQRLNWIKQVFSGYSNVRAEAYEGLTIDFCKKNNAQYLLRGLRNGGDFEYERTIAQMNRYMNSDIETVILFTDPEYSAINSTIVREIIKNKGDVKRFVPQGVNVYE